MFELMEEVIRFPIMRSWAVIVTAEFNLFYSCNFVMKTYVITVCIIIINYDDYCVLKPHYVMDKFKLEMMTRDLFHLDTWSLCLCILYVTSPSFSLSSSLSPVAKDHNLNRLQASR